MPCLCSAQCAHTLHPSNTVKGQVHRTQSHAHDGKPRPITSSANVWRPQDAVRAAGPLLTIIGFVVFPLLWSIPEALITAELATAFPENSGYVAWVTAAFGPFWGFQASVHRASSLSRRRRAHTHEPPPALPSRVCASNDITRDRTRNRV